MFVQVCIAINMFVNKVLLIIVEAPPQQENALPEEVVDTESDNTEKVQGRCQETGTGDGREHCSSDQHEQEVAPQEGGWS